LLSDLVVVVVVVMAVMAAAADVEHVWYYVVTLCLCRYCDVFTSSPEASAAVV
jgi:hypothetical protein